jgi:hypothetical protein
MNRPSRANLPNTKTNQLFQDLSFLIAQRKKSVTSHINNALALLFWQIGGKINSHVLEYKRAKYGEQIIVTLSRQLISEHGNNFEEKNLRRMMQFAEIFNDEAIVVTLSRQLSWSHFLILIPMRNRDARLFYAQTAAKETWGVRELRKNIENKLFERKSLAALQLHQNSTADSAVFKDPYFLDFLNLKNGYLETDLEASILRELEQFILELFIFGQKSSEN